LNKLQTLAFSGLLSLAPLAVQAAPSFVNGSFEDPAIPGLFWQYPSSLPGWTAISSLGAFNIHGPTLWPSQDGSQHIEFDSASAALSQSLSGFTAGTTYQLIFGLAGNPDRAAGYKIQASVNDSNSAIANAVFYFDSTGYTRSNIGWLDQSLLFTATDSSLTFVFSRADNGPTGWGPELDNVRIVATSTPVSEPQILSLISIGLIGTILRVKRKHS